MNKLVKAIFYFFVFFSLFGILFYVPALKNFLKPFPSVMYMDLIQSLYSSIMMMFFFYLFFEILFENKDKEIINVTSRRFWTVIMGCSILASFGMGVHFATQGIENFAKGTIIEPWVYFTNEPLAHGIIYITSILLSSFLVIIQLNRPFSKKLNKKEIGILGFSSFGLSVLWTVALLEGGSALLSLLIIILSFSITVYYSIFRHKASLLNSPWIIYYLICNIFSILFLILFGLMMNGYPQLSTLGFFG
ncbi:MAG: hypothetical protein KKF44_00560 [Nanoarchaeota archaeon]|nr:hypothetical protein [Nanoarchaeota archaeon]